MNRKQVEDWVGNPVYLQSWPYSGCIRTANGVVIDNYGVGKEWKLMKLTKGGLAIICDGVHTISVPPFDINTTYTKTK